MASTENPTEKRTTTNRQREWFDLHSISGVVLGLAMFIVCFSGVIALFAVYFPAWERPDLRASSTDIRFQPDQALAVLEREDPEMWSKLPFAKAPVVADEDYRPSRLFLFAPTPNQPFTHIRFFDAEAQVAHDFYVDLGAGKVVTNPHLGLRETLVGFHTDLLLPRPFGRYLVGVLGVGFLFVVTTGIFFHRKMLGQIFVFRRGRKLRQVMADSHKMFGVWGLLFHVMITFTGAFLGLIGIFLLVSALTVYRGDQEAAFAAVVPPSAEPIGEPADMLPLAVILERAVVEWPELKPERLTLFAYNDRNAEVTVAGPTVGRLAGGGPTGTEIILSAVDGEVRRVTNWANGSFWQRTVAWVMPLHYATFGGLMLKLAYCLLGLGSALMSVTGLLVWLERRDLASLRWLERLTVGVCAGQPAATAAVFLATASIPFDQPQRETWQIAAFLLTWLATIIFAFRSADRRRSAGWLLGSAGAVSILAALVDALASLKIGAASWQTGSTSAAGVSFFLLLFGFLLLWAGRALVSPKAEVPETKPLEDPIESFDQGVSESSAPSLREAPDPSATR